MTQSPNHAGGYVIAMRRVWENPAFKDLTEASIFVYLFMSAVWEPAGRVERVQQGRGALDVALARGQILASTAALAADFKVDRKKVARVLDAAAAAGMLSIEARPFGSVITITNYAMYQDALRTGRKKGGTAEVEERDSRTAKTGQPNGTAEPGKRDSRPSTENQGGAVGSAAVPVPDGQPSQINGTAERDSRTAKTGQPNGENGTALIKRTALLNLNSNPILSDGVPPPAEPTPRYAFEGKIIKLNAKDYEAFKAKYWTIPEMRLELEARDAAIEMEIATGRRKADGWFVMLTQMLNRTHQLNAGSPRYQAEAARRAQVATGAGGRAKITDNRKHFEG